MERCIVLFLGLGAVCGFFKELESCAETESTLLLTLVADLEIFSLSYEIPVAFWGLAPLGCAYKLI